MTRTRQNTSLRALYKYIYVCILCIINSYIYALTSATERGNMRVHKSQKPTNKKDVETDLDWFSSAGHAAYIQLVTLLYFTLFFFCIIYFFILFNFFPSHCVLGPRQWLFLSSCSMALIMTTSFLDSDFDSLAETLSSVYLRQWVFSFFSFLFFGLGLPIAINIRRQSTLVAPTLLF